MSNVNVVTLTGNVGADVELVTTKNGNQIAEFGLAVTKHKLDAQGQFIQNTDWFQIKCFGKLAQRISEKVGKGSKVAVVGELSTETWNDQATGAKRTKVIVIAETIENLTPRQTTGGLGSAYPEHVNKDAAPTNHDDFGDIDFDAPQKTSNGTGRNNQYQGRPAGYQNSGYRR